ncbi:MAG TPA: penicillin-binding transpeptidase domain-containing protein, partial [Bacteroidia bacterium]|nr:penicillin-binding transpeptidase domain-containing protein [Bacteroidia bacterium]
MNRFSERQYVIIGIFLLVGIAFIGRLFYIQIIDDSYKLDARNQAFRYVTQYPDRGYIFDRHGKILVYNSAAYDLMVIPHEAKNIDTLALCNLIGITKEDYIDKIAKASKLPNSPRHPSVFAAQLSAKTYALLQEQLYRFRGFYVETRSLRKYPMKIAANILGYVGEVNQDIADTNSYYKEGDYIGISGIEKSYEKQLRGKKGMKIIMVDVHNREMGSFKNGKYDTIAIPGENLTSSIDATLQQYGEKLLQNKVGSIVAIEPATGEILAMVTSPSYDPNLLVGRERSHNYAALARDTVTVPLFNRALMAQYPPGSTFKPIMALIAQQDGVLFPNTHYYCDGGYHMGNWTVKCDAVHGSLDLEHAIALSCNTYFCNVFHSVIDAPQYHNNTVEGFEAWKKNIFSFGIGKRLGIDLPNAQRGSVPSVNYYDRLFGKGSWKASNIISLAIGQGALGVNPLQLANEAAIIANRGFYYIPHVIKYIGDKKMQLPKYTTKQYT